MSPSEQKLKTYSLIGLATSLVLVAGAGIFYRERSFFTDTAYVLFNIINNGHMAIQFNRYGALVAQSIPWLGQKLHLPLTTILIAYSMGPYLFYALVTGVLIFWFRQYRMALLMTLFNVLFVSQSFYWGSEIPQGMAFLFLMMGTTLYMGGRKAALWQIAGPFVLFGILAVFTHFTIMMAAVYLWVYLILDKKCWPFERRPTIILSVLLVACMASKFVYSLVVESGAGDGPILKNIVNCTIRDVYSLFGTPVVSIFLYRCITIYWVGTVVFATGIASLFAQKQYRLAIWTLLSVLGYMFLVSLSFGGWDATASLFHIESEWLCMSVFLTTPFVFSLLPRVKTAYMPGVIVAIFMIRLIYIYQGIAPFRTHLHMQLSALEKMKSKGMNKVVLLRTAPFLKDYIAAWAAQYETMLLSAANGDKPQYTYCVVVGEDTAKIKAFTPGAFYTGFNVLTAIPLNKAYFSMDTVQQWQMLTYEELTGK